MTVYLIDGHNLLHEIMGRRPGGARGGAAQSRRAGSHTRGPRASAARDAAFAGSPTEAKASLEDERRRLIDRIASYMGGTSDRAIVVFDSRREVLQKIESATRNVEVYFGSFSRSADSVIEREVYALNAGENVVVVSSDYQLQQTVFLPNVVRRSSRQFIADLQEHTKGIANRSKCIIIGNRIEERIDSETVDRLKALRDELAAAPEGSDRADQGSDP